MLRALPLAVLCLALAPSPVRPHGRLLDPPARSSMWRFGFKTKPNYNDNELFCGGWAIQWQGNGGKCGVCGDPWHQKEPRDNEAGGKYAKGIIVRHYQPGQKITARVQLTANHRGFMEFKLCPNNNPKVEATQKCLDKYPLTLADGSGTRYYMKNGRSGDFYVDLLLPPGLECSQCVFQWTYTAGNNWGKCPDGKGRVGCGPQETFRGCADVQIGGQGGGSSTTDFIPPSKKPTPSWTTTTPKPRWTYKTTRPTVPKWTKWPAKTTPTPWWAKSTTARPMSTARPVYNVTYNWWKPHTHPQDKPSTPSTTVTQRPVHKWSTTKSKPSTVSTQRPYHKWSTPKTKLTTSRSTFAPRDATTPRPTYKPWFTKKPTYKPRTTERTKTPWVDINDIDATKEDDSPCRSRMTWKKMNGMNDWCEKNCARGYCPPSHCICY